MKKAIVTGATGFVGRKLCQVLSENGYSVVAIVRNKDSDICEIEHLRGISIFYCELSNFSNLDKIICDDNFDVMFHLAWAGTSGNLRADENVQLENVRFTCDALHACEKLNCKKFVFACSIMEYEITKLMETEIVPALSTLYSSAKTMADYFARTIAASIGVEYIRAVISNIYGPGEKSQRLINTSIRKLLNGEHCAFSDGFQLYDFIYIDDAVKAFMSIGELGKANRTYYIGSDRPRQLRSFLEEMKNEIDPNIELGFGEIPFGGVTLEYNEFDIHAVENDTGFVPTISFSQGIKNTIQWIRNN